MQQTSRSAIHIIIEWLLLIIIFLVVNLAGCHTVTEHLNHIFLRHLTANQQMFCIASVNIVIHPVLQMVFVSSLVVQPRRGVSLILTLCIVRAAVSLIVFRAHRKLRP